MALKCSSLLSFLLAEEANPFHKMSPSVDCQLFQSEGIQHSKQNKQVCLPVFTANSNDFKTRSNSGKHITCSRQPPNAGKTPHLYGDLGYFKRQPFLIYIFHTRSPNKSFYFPKIARIATLIQVEQYNFWRELYSLLRAKREGSLMAGLAEFCSYAGIDIGGKTQPKAMAVFQHFPKTYINRMPLRVEELCPLCLAEAFTPGLPGKSYLQSFHPRAGPSTSILLATITHTPVKKSKNQSLEVGHTFRVKMGSLTSHVLRFSKENVNFRGASPLTPTIILCNLIPCSTGTLTSSF